MVFLELILPAPLSNRALNQSVLIGQPILSATFANLIRLFSSKASPPTSIEDSLHLEVVRLLRQLF